MKARLVLCIALLATALVYWVGLHGPFLYDDNANLSPLNDWLQGHATWRDVVFGNVSGMLGRSVSMATFLFSAWLGGVDSFQYKLGNLAIHLACGVLGWLVLRRALAQDSRLSAHADGVATVVVALWLLHPLNVSTVLYVIQRMAQLSTLFVLASLWTYLSARRDLVDGRQRAALAKLFLLFPLLLLAGMLSKENAAIAPALCLVLELAYFSGQPRSRRAVQAFFGLFLALPALAVAAMLLLKPARFLGGYADRDFTLWQRVLSEPRALVDYIGTLLFPRNPLLGLYTDDFPVSTGLLSPPTTLLAILALLAISALAIALRRRAPSVFAGWFFFLVAHAVESSILPLDLYYEHRNYLPAFGLLLAVVGLCEYAMRNVRTDVLSLRQLGLLVAGGFAVVFAFSTHGRAMVWANQDTIVTQGVKYHPGSIRANVENTNLAMQSNSYTDSLHALGPILTSPDPRHRSLGNIYKTAVDCQLMGDADPATLERAVADAQPRLTVHEIQMFQYLAQLIERQHCGKVDDVMVADTIVRMLAVAGSQPSSARPQWRLRYIAADLYGHARHWQQALPLAMQAWQTSADPDVGALLARIYIETGMRPQAREVLAQAASRTNPRDKAAQAKLQGIRALLDPPLPPPL